MLVGLVMKSETIKHKGIQKLYCGDFNSIFVEKLPDGSQKITLTKDGEDKVYRFHVKNLYQEDEEILEYSEESIGEIPAHIKERMEKARKLLE